MSKFLKIMAQDSTARLVYPKQANPEFPEFRWRPFIAIQTGNILLPLSIVDALEMGWTRDDYEGIERALRNGSLQSKQYSDRTEYEYIDEAYFNWHLQLFFKNKRQEFLDRQKN